MSSPSADHGTLVPHPLPEKPAARLLLFAVRRMAAGGLNDAQAAHAMMTGFGLGFRRPLVLLRALMLEISRAAERRLVLAPCCCPRTTGDEAALLEAVRLSAVESSQVAHAAMAKLLAIRCATGAYSAALALAAACEDLGRPVA
ncbi:DUF6628 family protein [Sphingomonas jatrophae]|uniref:Uncharacterized protein n=1 Tax=Sphingomonas jatrophae TaxID=1166337 RepID=A0A1I6JT09_9SPHN|nr:DUF6628 family protein [Sphingomonas jatrophae]SFR82092.1 hypothetical protein SAMN05192580_0812 [Sphingomonas jatrophae]